jgi:3-hydroxyisobutyrate dehydrogenase-like beta-hydroxyacid dehydrogenase
MGRIGRLGTQEAANKAKIGFLGLGEMGTPMASRLLHAGHDVIVWNRTVERTAPLAQQGAAVASSPAKAAAGASFVITMLDAVADSPIGPIVAAKRGNVESGHFAHGFKLRLAAKDLSLVMEAAAARDRHLKQAQANRAWLDEAAERGAADLDFSAVVATIGGQ